MKKEPSDILLECSTLFRVTVPQLLSRRRYEPLITFRKSAMAVMHKHGHSPTAIAHAMKKDRTTVIQNLQSLGLKKGARNKD